MHDSKLSQSLDKYLTTPPDDGLDFIEIEQDPDLTDSDMMEIIREKLSEGWRLEDYRWDQGVKKYLFEFK